MVPLHRQNGYPTYIRLWIKRLSSLVLWYNDLHGQDRFQCLEHDVPKPIASWMANDHIRSVSAVPFSASLTRKVAVLAVRALLEEERPLTEAGMKLAGDRAFDLVAEARGNPRKVCRRYDVHPRVMELFATDGLRPVFAATKATTQMEREEWQVHQPLRRARGSRGRRAA